MSVDTADREVDVWIRVGGRPARHVGTLTRATATDLAELLREVADHLVSLDNNDDVK